MLNGKGVKNVGRRAGARCTWNVARGTWAGTGTGAALPRPQSRQDGGQVGVARGTWAGTGTGAALPRPQSRQDGGQVRR
jgi:hypothetical protein